MFYARAAVPDGIRRKLGRSATRTRLRTLMRGGESVDAWGGCRRRRTRRSEGVADQRTQPLHDTGSARGARAHGEREERHDAGDRRESHRPLEA